MGEVQQLPKVVRACNCLIKPRLKAPVEEVWKVFGDFGAIGKILTNLKAPGSKIIEGENNIPYCVRYVTGENPDGSISFANERLLSIDNEKHNLTYKIEENTFGMIDFVSHLSLEDGGDGTTILEWGSSFDVAEGVDAKFVETLLTGVYAVCAQNAEKLALGSSTVVPETVGAA